MYCTCVCAQTSGKGWLNVEGEEKWAKKFEFFTYIWFIDNNIGMSNTNLNGNMGERGENTTIRISETVVWDNIS